MSSAPPLAEQLDAMREQNRRLERENDQLAGHNGDPVSRNGELGTQLQDLTRKLELYEEQVAWLKNKLYGRGTEKLSDAERQQLRLFDEIESSADGEPEDEPPAADQAAGAAAKPRRRPKRKPLPEWLPRVERVIDLAEQDKQCACGHEMVRIGEDCAERFDVIPPQMQVIRTVRPKYACHHCEGSGDEDRPAVRMAPAPPALIPKGLASAGLLAFIATAKFCDALPLYRQQRQFARLGVELSRRTMSDWMIAAAAACEPLLELLVERLRSGPALQIDENTVQVLKEPNRDNTTKSYVWVARGGPPEAPVLVYRYEPSRGAWVAADVIGDYQGYVQTDGYGGYERPCSRPGIVHVGCWAHLRRAFKEAADAQSKVSNRVGTAHQALAYIAKLYRIESELSEYRQSDPDQFAAERRARAQPVLDKMYGWLRQKQDQVPPRTAVGKAISFALGQWPKVIRYLLGVSGR